MKPELCTTPANRKPEADAATVVNDLTAKSEAVRKSIGDLAYTTADSLEPVKSTIAQRLVDDGRGPFEDAASARPPVQERHM